jgi:hypothetical protein
MAPLPNTRVSPPLQHAGDLPGVERPDLRPDLVDAAPQRGEEANLPDLGCGLNRAGFVGGSNS